MSQDSAHRYVLFSARYAPEVGGVESFTAHLARELAEEGHRVTVVTSAIAAQPGVESQPDGVEVVRLPCRPLMGGRLPVPRKNALFKVLLARVEEARPDRVLVNTRFYGLSLVGLGLAQRIGAKAVVLDHGSAYLTLGNAAADVAIHVYEHVMTRRCCAYAPVFAGISSFSARWLRTFGIDTDVVIPNAIDAVAFREERSSRDFRQELGIDAQKLVVSIGRLTPEKGSRELVEAARIVGGGFAFAFAGEGPLREVLERDLPQNVTLLGNLTHPDLSALLSQADLFCLPTRSEGFCTSLLEAGAWGLTPAMTHVGGTDEIMGDPVRFGALLPSMDAQDVAASLMRLERDGSTGRIEALREHVETNCSWRASARALDRAFASRQG
jgi:glycosyltransferase involved in cell wall biosynthesis